MLGAVSGPGLAEGRLLQVPGAREIGLEGGEKELQGGQQVPKGWEQVP